MGTRFDQQLQICVPRRIRQSNWKDKHVQGSTIETGIWEDRKLANVGVHPNQIHTHKTVHRKRKRRVNIETERNLNQEEKPRTQYTSWVQCISQSNEWLINKEFGQLFVLLVEGNVTLLRQVRLKPHWKL